MSISAAYKVSLQQCEAYQPDTVLAAVRACLAPLGGMAAFVRPGQRVLVKPNLLMGIAPDAAVTTHPAVLDAVLTLVREAGGIASVGDSPGMGELPHIVSLCGVQAVLDKHGVPLADFTSEHIFTCEDNLIGKRIALVRALAEADVFITLPKLKTHVQMVMTCAVKNQYGLVPGVRKGQYHLRLKDRAALADLLIDINRIAKPALGIVDAIDAMEGNGPSGGTPRRLGVLMASTDMMALDVTACAIIGLDPAQVPSIQAGRRRGYGAATLDAIEISGVPLERVRANTFRLIEHVKDIGDILPLPAFMLAWVRRHWAPRPRIIAQACIRCFACHKGCPVQPPAIDPARPPRARVNDRTCIRCYCCHEFCPAHAIVLKRTWLDRMISFTRVFDWCARKLHRVVRWMINRT